jgi:hypothetical protein
MAGRSDIIVTGLQDIYLTGQPQMSYFMNRFKQHTKFTTQTLEMPFNGEPDRGKTIIAPISTTSGDMISNMTLKIFVSDNITTNVYDSFIKSTIEYIDLFIGKQHIDRLDTEYISMYMKLRSSETGDLNILYRDSYNVNSHFSKDIPLYLDLPFYFYKKPHLAIPLCAMHKHSLEVHVKLREPVTFQNEYMPVDYSNILTIRKISLNVDYHHLMEMERNFFKTRPIEYIITQTQKAKKEIKSSDIDKEHTFMCNFKHPVREFLFFLRHDAWEKLTNRGNINEELDYANLRINREILFDGSHVDLSSDQFLKRYKAPSDIIEEELIWHRNSNYYNKTFVPLNDILTLEAVRDMSVNGEASLGFFKRFKVKNGLFYAYALGLNHLNGEPSGHLNMSRIIHQQFTFKFKTPDTNSIYSVWNSLHNATFTIYAVSNNILTFEGGLSGLKY